MKTPPRHIAYLPAATGDEIAPRCCAHCQTPFTPSKEDEVFCCHGCEYVHALIHSEGLDQFYDLQNQQSIRPVRGTPFEPQDLSWLEELQLKSENDQHGSIGIHAEFSVDGLSCVACVWLIEKIYLRMPGALLIDAQPSTAQITLTWEPGKIKLTQFANELATYGYQLHPKSDATPRLETADLIARLGLSGAFAMNAMVFTLPRYLGMPDDFAYAPIFELVTLLTASLSMLIGGSYFIRRAAHSVYTRVPHIDLPIALGIIVAFIGSLVGWIARIESLLYFDFICTFIFLMLVGRYLQVSAIQKNRHRLHRRRPIPDAYENAEQATMIPLAELAPGSHFRILPGQSIPVSAILQSPAADFSLEWINGEAQPQTFRAGRTIPAGAILLHQQGITAIASEKWEDSVMARLMEKTNKSIRVPALEKLLRNYLWVILAIGISGFITLCILATPTVALQAMISVFVVSCPCALGVAIPLADEWAGNRMERLGVFIRQNLLWSRLRTIRTIIFDKTGTLTLERPVLKNPETLATLPPHATLALAQLTYGSLHPISRTLHEQLGTTGQLLLRKHTTPTIHDEPGLGRWFIADDLHWTLGRPGWGKQTHSSDDCDAELCCNGSLIARFHFQETLRPDAIESLSRLRLMGYRLIILSGDNPDKVNAVATALGIPAHDAHARLLPHQKQAIVQQLDAHDTLYLGDGANDSLALDAAYLTGTPVVDRSFLEAKADFYFLGKILRFLPYLLDLAKLRRRNIRRSFIFALLYNLTAISASLAGLMNPLIAAIIMPLSSIISLSIASLGLRQAKPLQIGEKHHPSISPPTGVFSRELTSARRGRVSRLLGILRGSRSILEGRCSRSLF